MKRVLFTVLLCLAAFAPAPALRAADTPNYQRREIIYGRKFGTALTLDAFTPKSQANGAGIIVVVSGGWVSNHDSITPMTPGFIQPFLNKGYTVFAVCHGCQPRYPIPDILEDMDRAVRYIRHNAHDFGIDPDRLGITGGSAGGHLSLMQGCAGKEGNPKAGDAVDRESSRVQAVVSFFPPTDFLNWGEKGKIMLGAHPVPIKGAFDFQRLDRKVSSFVLITDETEREKIGKDISPISHVSKQNPPTLIIHGDKDLLVPLQQSEIMQRAMKDAGATVELIVKKGGGHDGRLMGEYMPKTLEWFAKYLPKKEK